MREAGAELRFSTLLILSFGLLLVAFTVKIVLRPLSLLYALLAKVDRSLKLRRIRRFPVPVISVGAIAAGGSGKTPVVREIVRRLQGEFRIILLSRGYGRKGGAPLVWRAGEAWPDPELFGDEPALLARSMKAEYHGILGVGPDRASLLESILTSLDVSGASPADPPILVVLDDGFQHARLHRDLDIVIVDDRTVTERFLIPAGYLRESFSALRRGGVLLATSAKAERLAETYLGPHGRVIPLRFFTGGIGRWGVAVSTAPTVPTVRYEGKGIVVTGIARPERVRRSAEEAGFEVLGHRKFRDHYRYSAHDAREIVRWAHELRTDIVLTTEKDAVKLERFPELQEFLYVLPLEVEVPEMEHLLETIRSAARQTVARQGPENINLKTRQRRP